MNTSKRSNTPATLDDDMFITMAGDMELIAEEKERKKTTTYRASRTALMEEDTRAELPQGLATFREKREGIINFVPFKCKMTTFTKMNISKYVEKAKCSGNGKCNGITHHEQHEAIFAECMPYFDFDVKLKDRDELLSFQGKAEGTIKGTLLALFPHCKLYCSTSHGSVKDKDNEIWKFSMHVVMRGDGYFSNAPNVKKFYIKIINDTLAKSPINGIKIVCDPVPYHNGRQLLRCLFANKYPNKCHEDYKTDRLKNIQPLEEDKTDFRTFHPCEWFKDTDNYKYYFAQYIGDEDLSEHDGQEGIHGKEDKYFTRSGPSALDVFNDDDKFITNKDDMEILEEKGAKKATSKTTNNNTAEGEGDEIILTLEELTEVINALTPDRFKDYNEWCHLLWIVTRYCDKMNYDPDDAWELLETFCKTCEGWQKGAVRKKMNEANKFSDNKQIKKMGTVLMWLKEDNRDIFNKYVKSKITQDKTTVTEFDKMNPYVWIDFKQDHDRVFSSYEELENSINTKINLVLARISAGSGFYLKKDGVDNISTIDKLGDENFTLKYEDNEKKIKKLVRVQLLKYISDMKSSPFKLYSMMDCYPLKESCPHGVYNLWYGIKAQEVKELDEEKIKPFLYILKTLWANDDDHVYKFLIAWFRMAICEPEKMIRTALFLYSKKEGTGKGRIVDFITDYVLGPAVCHIFTGMNQVLTEHNTNIAGKKIICINEMAATKKEFLSNFDKLKPIISDRHISENPKFKDIKQIKNITNVIMCTQHKNSIYIKRGNRRFTCLEVADKKKEDVNFWEDLSKNYMNQEAGNHFYTWLLRQDKTQLPNPSIFCETKLRKEIIQISHDNTESFMDIITKHDGEDSDEFGPQTLEIYELSRKQNEQDGLYYIKCSDMYNIYKSYCGECGEHPKTLNAFKANSDIENVLTIKQINGIKHYRVL